MTQPDRSPESAPRSQRRRRAAPTKSIGDTALHLVEPEVVTWPGRPLTNWGLQLVGEPNALEQLFYKTDLLTNYPQPIAVVKMVVLYPDGIAFTDLRDRLYSQTTPDLKQATNLLHSQLATIGELLADHHLEQYWSNAIIDDDRIVRLFDDLPTEDEAATLPATPPMTPN